MDDVDQELRRRGLKARLALLKLFDHSNMQVRLEAAKCSLGVAPEANQFDSLMDSITCRAEGPIRSRKNLHCPSPG
jgi:hypothetical protein